MFLVYSYENTGALPPSASALSYLTEKLFNAISTWLIASKAEGQKLVYHFFWGGYRSHPVSHILPFTLTDF